MSQRFFSPQLAVGKAVLLTGPEAHHLLHVMRAKIEDQVELFDGSGEQFCAKIVRCTRKEVELSVLSSETVNRELTTPLLFAVAIPKGDRQKFLIEKMVELGVTAVLPLITQHSISPPSDKTHEKLQRSVFEAMKQCGRNRVMLITKPVPFKELTSASFDPNPLLQQAAQTLNLLPQKNIDCSNIQRLIAHPYGQPVFDLTTCAAKLSATNTLTANTSTKNMATVSARLLAIGPEGGFTEEELTQKQAAENLWQAVSLGPRILRIETATLLLASCFGMSEAAS